MADDAPETLPQEFQQLLREHAQRCHLKRGESLFLKGSEPDALFGVVSGRLRVSASGRLGREAVIAMLGPGHWFGEVSLLIGRERVYDTVATEPSEVAVVLASDFHRLIAERADLHMAFTRLVCHRLRHALAWIDDMILEPLPSRLAHQLLALDARGAATGPLALSQDDLAAMLGVSRQSVNRQLRQWADAGVIELHYGQVLLRDRAALGATATGAA